MKETPAVAPGLGHTCAHVQKRTVPLHLPLVYLCLEFFFPLSN